MRRLQNQAGSENLVNKEDFFLLRGIKDTARFRVKDVLQHAILTARDTLSPEIAPHYNTFLWYNNIYIT